MKLISPSLALSLCLFFSQGLYAQADAHYCDKARKLLSQIDQHHIQPRQLDDRLSEEIFDAFIERLDPGGFFFLQKDIADFSVYRHRIDEQIPSQNCVFLRKITETYQQRLLFIDSVVQGWGQKPFDLQAKDQLRYSSEPERPESLISLEEKWHKLLKNTSLSYLLQRSEALPQGEELSALEAESRTKVMLRTHCRLERILKVEEGFDYYVGKLFLKTLALRFDPHTAYFSAAGKSAFESSLAKEGFTFGLELEESKENELTISSMLPGGPAWKSNQLNQGDVVLNIKLSGGEEIDLLCLDVGEISEIIRQTSSAQLEIEVKKKSGQSRKVLLAKEKMAVQENVISSFVLEGEKKVGYIYLPGFYTHWEDERALGLSNDVAKELLKLQLEGIEGLILDLRHNGGGAIIEALGLAGIFIDIGPLALGKDASGELNILKDMNRGMAYGGPLVVLVDGLSASASEIFAAAMQDYQRAVIVGDTTYGKSSGQQFVPLDRQKPHSGGDLKLTLRKFYRITGNTYQREGVVPDVVLPYLLKAWTPREKDDPEALSNDKVDKSLTYRKSAPLPLEQLAQKSKDRLAADGRFGRVQQASDSLQKNLSQGEIIPLDLEGYFQYRKKLREEMERMMALEERKAESFEAKNNRFAENLAQLSEVERLNSEKLIAEIQNDIYLEETYRILLDLINHK